MTKDKKIGFIGLGIMGKPMAKNLMRAGYEVTAYDISQEAVENVAAAGAEGAKSAKEVAEKSDVIITMLPSDNIVKEAVLGKNGVIEGIEEGAVLIDMSSVAPATSKELSKKIMEKGAFMLDAPVSGGEPKAIDGTMAIMAGGEEKVFNDCRDILLSMGSSAVLIGAIGSGNVAKLANQIIVALNIAAMGEALVMATKAGADPEKVYEAIRGGLAGSTVLDAKAPMVLDGNFTPGARLELHIKDLTNAINTAHEVGSPVPLSAGVMEIMQQLKADGKINDDHGGLIQYYEKLSGVKARRKLGAPD